MPLTGPTFNPRTCFSSHLCFLLNVIIAVRKKTLWQTTELYWQSLFEWRNYHLTSSVDQATSLSPRAAVQWRSFLLISMAFKGIRTTLKGMLKATILFVSSKQSGFSFKWTNVPVWCFIFCSVVLSEHFFFPQRICMYKFQHLITCRIIIAPVLFFLIFFFFFYSWLTSRNDSDVFFFFFFV